MDILTSAIAFIVALGLLVTFHEYGHFIVARKLGIKVIRFSVGFGKPLLRRTARDGTEYVLAAIPLGGYVKMLDEREGPVPEDQIPHAFNRKPLWARTLVVLAGPVFNFIFAIVAYWCMFMIGTLGFAPIIGQVTPNSPAALNKLEPMMEIVEVSETPTRTWQQVVNAILPSLGDNQFDIQVKLPDSDRIKTINFNIPEWNIDNKAPDILGSLGIEPYRPDIPAIVGEVVDGEPADDAGLLAEDRIVAINGIETMFWNDFVEIIQPLPNQQVTVEVMRGSERLSFEVNLTETTYQGKQVGYLGVIIKPIELPSDLIRKEQYGPIESLSKAFDQTWHFVTLTLSLLAKMVTGKIGLESISGPITIAQGAGATASIGLAYYLGFLGLISISLGVINLLPIPVLDGGHLMFYAIEAITRKPPSERFMQACYHVGILLLIGLMVLAFYNDIIRLL